ncbi:hypothetical protein [Nocardioides jejuensis]|uniref:Uncharacterized protein n=1 Tax=Nocardioides jejuensis TaxID=2502782 RepID=A0A4R1CHW5_9ACTN|nr:hypothetical protein [Nocardioides jejuensis]TCJ30890.1 hypothetical protein EPD65_02305 [Nocardioides jejuensis]
MTRRKGRADAIDRAWSGIRYTRACVGLEVPPLADLRAALVTVARLDPVVARHYAPDGSWRAVADDDLAAWSASVVTAVDDSNTGTDQILARAREAALTSRFHVLVGTDWLALAADHGLGDGQTADLLLVQLLLQAASGATVPLHWQRLGPVRRDARVAAGVARNIGSVRWVLDHRQALAGGSYGPMEPTEPHRLIVDVSDADFMAGIRKRRDEHHPGASAAAVAIAGLRAGIAAELGEPRPGFECLFNTRARDRGGLTAWGNWSAGVYLEPTDDDDPSSIGATLAEARSRGVASYALAATRAAARRAGRSEGPRGVIAEGRPRLTVSYMTDRGLAAAPGFVPGQTLVVTDTVPNGLDTITFQIVETAGRLVVSTAFFPEAWEPDRVAAGVRRFLSGGQG